MTQFICIALLSMGHVQGTCDTNGALASKYGEQVTIATLEKRLEWGHVSAFQAEFADGFVAVLDCSMIGEWVVIRPAGSSTWENHVVYDCAGRNDPSTIEFMSHVAVEVDYYTADRWGFDCTCGFEIEVMDVTGELIILGQVWEQAIAIQ